MNFGIIGTGTIGRFHAEAIRAIPGAALRSVCNRRPADFGVMCYTDIGAFLADPGLDIVTIATPSGAHLEPAIAALRAGKHVICEKPLEISTDRIDVMIAAAVASGKTLAAILNRRFTPAMDVFKAACDGGRFGKIVSASIHCYISPVR